MFNHFIIGSLKFLAVLFSLILKPFVNHHTKGDPVCCTILAYCGTNNTGAEARVNEIANHLINEFGNTLRVRIFTLDKLKTKRYIKNNNIEILESHPVNIIKNSLLISQSHINILAEGSTFDNTFSDILLWCYLYFVDLSNRLGVYTVAYAVDAGKINEYNKAFCAQIANKIDLIMLRTGNSKRILNEIGVNKTCHVTADTAFSLEPASDEWYQKFCLKQKIDSSRPVIIISYRNFYCWPVKIDIFKYFSGNRNDQCIDILYYSYDLDEKKKLEMHRCAFAEYADDCYKKYNAQIILLAMESSDNLEVQNISKLMKSPSYVVLSDEYNAREIASIIKHSTFIVTARYHALIFALLTLKPFILLSIDQRTEGIFKELNVISDYVINYYDVQLREKLIKLTAKIIEDKEVFKNSIKEILPVYKSRMNENTKLFKELVISKFDL